MLKKLLIALTVTTVLLSAAGYVVVFKMKQSAIRELMRERIEAIVDRFENLNAAENLHVLAFSRLGVSTIHWVRKGKEFWFHGQLFDIVRSEVRADSVFYYCLSDDSETALNQVFNSELQKFVDTENDNSNTTAPIFKKKMPLGLPLCPNALRPYNNFFIRSSINPTAWIEQFYGFCFLQKITPPPKV